MRTVYKYVFEGSTIELSGVLSPGICHVGSDPASGLPAVWVELFTENPERILFTPTDLSLQIVGTGHEVPDGYRHVGSMIQGMFVWHVFARTSETLKR